MMMTMMTKRSMRVCFQDHYMQPALPQRAYIAKLPTKLLKSSFRDRWRGSELGKSTASFQSRSGKVFGLRLQGCGFPKP